MFPFLIWAQFVLYISFSRLCVCARARALLTVTSLLRVFWSPFTKCVCVCVCFRTAVFIAAEKGRYGSSCQLFFFSCVFLFLRSPVRSQSHSWIFPLSLFLTHFFYPPSVSRSPNLFPRLISNSLLIPNLILSPPDSLFLLNRPLSPRCISSPLGVASCS